ncbi:hypothetical protein Tco_0980936 [Tanacetum coccineum]
MQATITSKKIITDCPKPRALSTEQNSVQRKISSVRVQYGHVDWKWSEDNKKMKHRLIHCIEKRLQIRNGSIEEQENCTKRPTMHLTLWSYKVGRLGVLNENKGKVPTEGDGASTRIIPTRISHEVSVSTEGVEELKEL